MKRFIFLFVSLGYISTIIGQKPIIDSTAIEAWSSVNFPNISNDGHYILYTVKNSPIGSNTLVIQCTNCTWRKEFPRVDRGVLTQDSKWAIFKSSKDSLCLVSLGKDETKYISHVRSYELVKRGTDDILVYFEGLPSNELVVHSLQSGMEQRFSNVTDYLFNKQCTILLLEIQEKKNSIQSSVLKWLDVVNGENVSIWRGEKAYNFSFDSGGTQIAFIATMKDLNSLWYYRSGMDSALLEADEKSDGLDSSLIIEESAPVFTRDGNRLFFKIMQKPPPATTNAVKLDIWSYKDVELQSSQLQNISRSKIFTAFVHIGVKKVVRLQQENEEILLMHGGMDNHAVTYSVKGGEGWWNRAAFSTIYLESTVDASRTIVKDRLEYPPNPAQFNFSPDGKWMLYFDRGTRAWFSLDVEKGISLNITKKIPHPVYNENCYEYAILPPYSVMGPVGVGGWIRQKEAVLIYDDYDIWQVDPTGLQNPVNVTNGYGRKHHIKFRLAFESNKENMDNPIGDTLLLCAFDPQTKSNGFYRKPLFKLQDPELLTMGPYVLYAVSSQLKRHSNAIASILLKAQNANIWLVSRRTSTEALNFYITSNFKTFKPVSDINPQKDYNWLTTTLIHWKMYNGKIGSGILYKPENFDINKKYPVIFNYYEQRSDNLNDFLTPSFSSAEIDIPYFVSRGYLVFVPDIYYKIGATGESALNSVVSAIEYLAKFPYIDIKHIGVQGHSFGGFETNYLITHTHFFAAAAEAAGQTDYVSGYGSLTFGYGGEGSSMQYYQEISQGRIGASLWQRPDLYIKNSPIFRANQVTTPLLMMHNKKDGSVPFNQAIEFFTALRRLGKRVWLLQYDQGAHVVGEYKDKKDYTIRLTQFFDHYLKDISPPIWMSEGIPARWKGIKAGFELEKADKNN